MPRGKHVPITGAVLKWAIQEAGLTEEEIAARLDVSLEVIRNWEKNRQAPSQTQFNRLTGILKRPSAVFFLPKPPEALSIEASFRQAPGLASERLTPEEARWLRVAKRLQKAGSWVLEELHQPGPDVPHFDLRTDPDVVAEKHRSSFGVSFSTQVDWPNANFALKTWRVQLEKKGFLVFQLRLGKKSSRGFSIWDERAPLIAVNTAYNEPARIYTLFHEYGHLLTRTDSICTNFYAPAISQSNHAVERWCEQFAASFLIPRIDLLRFVNSLVGVAMVASQDLGTVSEIAKRYKVSLRAAALRLIHLQRATPELYSEVDKRAVTIDKEKPRGGGRGFSRRERRLQEFGERLPAILLRGMRKEVLDTHEVLDYIDVSTSQLDELEEILSER